MWDFVPQLFYDFLARIVPGAILLVCCALIVMGPTSLTDFISDVAATAGLSSFGPFVLWALASYFVGFTLGQVWDGLFDSRWSWLAGRFKWVKDARDRRRRQAQDECIIQHNLLLTALGRPALRIGTPDLSRVPIMHDHIRHVAPGDAARLLKIRGERRLCEVLVVGFAVLWVLNLWYVVHNRDHPRLSLVFVLPVLVALLWGKSQRLHGYLAAGTTTGWLSRIVSECLPVGSTPPPSAPAKRPRTMRGTSEKRRTS